MNSRVAEFIPSYAAAKGMLPNTRSSPYVGDVDVNASSSRATSSMSGMNLSASEWVPQGKRTMSIGSETVVATNSITSSYIDQEYPSFVDSDQLVEQHVEEAYYSPTEKMVEITWNGSVFFVPQDSIEAYPGAEHQTSVLPDDGDAGGAEALFGGDHPLSEAVGDIEPATAANGFGFGST